MTTMIDKIAQAITPVIERDNDIYWASEYGRPMPQESARAIVRAALTVLLEPSNAMINAGECGPFAWEHSNDSLYGPSVRQIYQAMIRTALDEVE